MERIPDFTGRQNFPGTLDNEFDIILRRVEEVEKVPSLLFAGILFLIALPPTFGQWGWTLGLWVFFLVDWLLLALLPRFGRSYGPPKPPTLILALLRMVFAFLPFPIAVALQGAGTLLIIDGFWVAPFHLAVTRQKLYSPKLKPGRPVRILHLGDMHVERITERERKLNYLIEALKPDLILFSGDILNLSYVEDPIAIEEARKVLAAWRAPAGVFVVSGSPAVDLEHIFPKLVKGLDNLCWLQKDRIPVRVNEQEIDIIGLTCTHKPFIDGPQLENLLVKTDAVGEKAGERFTILLYHTPDLAPNAARTGKIDLQLSGHTHGGQIRLPGFGAPFAGSLYGKRFESGRTLLGPLTLYVSRGIGMEGKAAPRVRFFCPPEIILWEIDGEEERMPKNTSSANNE